MGLQMTPTQRLSELKTMLTSAYYYNSPRLGIYLHGRSLGYLFYEEGDISGDIQRQGVLPSPTEAGLS